jgi:hypothetical protein
MPDDENYVLSPQISETITNPDIRRRALVAIQCAEAWQEALVHGDILEADAQFEKLKHMWNLITSDYEAEQNGEVASQYTCARYGATYSQREYDTIEMIVCAPDTGESRPHKKSDLGRLV